jgi:hypothetical protein
LNSRKYLSLQLAVLCLTWISARANAEDNKDFLIVQSGRLPMCGQFYFASTLDFVDRNNGKEWQLVPSFSLGLTDSWAIEVKSRLDRPIGDSLQYESSAVALTHRWTPRSSRLSLGSSFEFEYARDASHDNRWVLGGIGAYEGALWSSALNVYVEHEMGEPTEWNYSAAAKRKINDRLAWGLEGAGSFRGSYGAEALAALYWRPSPRLTVNFGLGEGLDGAGNLLVRSGFVVNLW